MRRAEPALAALVLLLLGAGSAAAQTTRLLGRVVGLRGEPVRDVRVRIVGHGEPEIFASGEFEIQLAGQPAQVEVQVVGSGLQVLYPLHGALAVPRDANVRVPVVVGESERAYINDVLAARLVQLESTLRRNGVAFDATTDSLNENVRRIIEILGSSADSLRDNIERQRKQADVKPALLASLDAYLFEVKDLRDAFRLLAPYAARNREAAIAMQRAMQEYTDAYVAVDTSRNAFLSRIRSDWPGQQAELLARDLDDVYTEIVQELHHAYVLPVNESLIALQAAHGPGGPGSAQIQRAIAAVADAAQRIDARIAVLETRYARLREALERS